MIHRYNPMVQKPEPSQILVYVASMADFQDQDDKATAMAFEHDPVITHPQAIFGGSIGQVNDLSHAIRGIAFQGNTYFSLNVLW